MSIFIKARGYRGIERADIDIDPVALVGGLNYAGKSSLAQAVAAAVTGSPIPFFRSTKPDKPLLTKTDAKELLRGGMDKGSIEILLDGTTTASVLWPGLTCEGDGRLQCSKIAAGLVNPMEMDDGDRQKFFAELLKATPTEEDLRLALMESVPELGDENGGERLKQILEMVHTSGYDPVHTSAKESGARSKGQWEVHSGEPFGSKKAMNWQPAAWRDDLDGKTVAEMGTAVTEAEERLRTISANSAVADAALFQLEADAQEEGKAWTALKEAERDLAEKQENLNRLKKLVNEVVIPTAIPCAHCGGLLDLVSGKHGTELRQSLATADEIQAAKDLHASRVNAVTAAQATYETSAQVHRSAKGAHEALKGSAERLKAAKDKKGSADDVAQAQDFVNGLRADQAMVKAKIECAAIAQRIAQNQKIVDVLAPDGLRRQKLVKALSTFNQKFLAVLCSEAEYPAVTLDNDLEVLYGGRRHFLLSASEKYRVQAVLQLAIAQYDKSPLVIYDGADILDAEGRNGLFKMMGAVETSFLVCMTLADIKKVPNLATAEMGKSYWIEDNIAAEIK